MRLTEHEHGSGATDVIVWMYDALDEPLRQLGHEFRQGGIGLGDVDEHEELGSAGDAQPGGEREHSPPSNRCCYQQ